MCSFFYVADIYASCESFSAYVVQAIITQASLMYEVKYEIHLQSTLPLLICHTIILYVYHAIYFLFTRRLSLFIH